jgi:hypothetical protein
MDILRYCVPLVEFFFAAPEHSFLYMEGSAENAFTPVLADKHDNEEDLPALAQIHDAVLEYVREMLDATGGYGPGVRADEAVRLLKRLLTEPTAEEAERLGKINYADGYGSFFKHSRMAAPSGLKGLGLSKQKWKAEFKAAHWRKGYYVQLSRFERFVFKILYPAAKFSKPHG